jgi:Fe-S-cluster containining protein
MRNSRRDLLPASEAVAAVQAVYAELEARPVERECVRRTECCQFRLTGKTPYLTRGEAMVAVEALRRSGVHRLPPNKNGNCPLLVENTGQCSIYADRPFGCRTHFCAAAGGLRPRKEIQDLIWRLEDLDTRLGGVGPQKLPVAIEEALERAQSQRGAPGQGVQVKDAPRSRGR